MIQKHLLIFLLFFTGALFAQTPDNLIPRELLFKEKDKTKVALSKNGETIFYQKTGPGTENSVFYTTAKSPLVERSKEFPGKLVSWLPTFQDGLVAVTAQDTNLQVYYTTVNANNVKQLEVATPFTRLTFLSLSSRFPNKVLVNLEAKNELESGIFLLDLLNGGLRLLTQMDDFQELFFDENFALVAGIKANDVGGNSIFRKKDGQWVEVFKYPFTPDMFIGGLSKIICVSNDGKTIYATDNFNKDKTTLVAIDAENGAVTELMSDADADILPFAANIDATGKPSAVVALWGDTKRHFLDPTLQKDYDYLENTIGKNVGFAAASEDDKVWLVRSLDGGPQRYFHFDRSAQKLTYLFNDFTHLDGWELATRHAFTVTARDNMKLPVQVYLPTGMEKADGLPKVPLPTIIYVHGGPWAGVTHWNNWFHTRNFQLLANRGYAVINMEFRGTTGLGKNVTDAGNLQWGNNMYNDIVDVATWAIKAGIANRKKVGMWGWSYGGYATNFALAANPDMFACGLSMYGISDLEAFGKLPFADNDFWHARVGNPHTEEGAILLKSYSPTTYLPQIKSPLLLTTGSLDERVPQSQSDDFAKALADAGKEVVYFYYPEEGHDYRSAESWVSFWAIAEYFLHHNLGGRKEARKEDIEKGNFKAVYGEDYILDID